MKKQTSNLINALVSLKGNLTSAKAFINNNKIQGIYFFSNAYSDFNLFKAIYQAVTPGDPQIDMFLQAYEEFYLEINKHLVSYVEDSALNQLHQEIMITIHGLEIYLLNLIDQYR